MRNKLKVTIEIDYPHGKSVQSYESYSDKEDFDMDEVLQAICYVIPKHDIGRSAQAVVIQAFDKDQQVVGHGEF